MPPTVIISVLGVVFLASAIRALFGFGEAIVGMPLLLLLPVGLNTAVSLIGLAGLTVAVLSTATGWRHLNRPVLLRLAATSALGIPAGLALVTFAPRGLVTTALGALLVCYGAHALARPALPHLADRRWALPFGFAAGALGSAYNFNGVPVVVYGSLCRWSPERFRAMLQAHFLISGVLVVAGQACGGLWSAELGPLYLGALPVILAATGLGVLLRRRIPAEKFPHLVHGLVVVLGAVLLLGPAA